jgi:hypothetical protein
MQNIHFMSADLRGAKLDWQYLKQTNSEHVVRGAIITPSEYEAIPLTEEQKNELELKMVSL